MERNKSLRVLEGGDIVENFWQDKVEERPELRQVVLEGS